MILFRTSLCILAALATAALRAQTANPANHGVIVVEHGGDRIELRLQPGATHPTVSVNGKAVPAREWQTEGGKHSTKAGEWQITTTSPSGGWQTPFVYSWGVQDAARNWLQATPNDSSLWGYFTTHEKSGEPRPHIGVQVGSLPPALAEQLNLDAGRCVLIVSATAGGPAATAGIKANDVLLAIDGTEGVTDETLRDAVAGKHPGDTLTLRVLRKGKKQDIKVEVGKETSGAGGFPKFDVLRANGLGGTNPKAPLTYSTSPWPGYRNLLGQRAEGGDDNDAERSKATLESLQRQVEQIRQLCDRLEKQLEKSGR